MNPLDRRWINKVRIVEPIEAPPPFPERTRKSDRIPGARPRRQRPVRGLHSSPGNLISKSDLGSYRYNASGASSVRPHALTRVDLNAGTGGGYRTFQYDANGNLTAAAQYDNSNNVIAARGRSGGYTSFNMPQFIDGPSISTNFAYGPEHQRVRQMSGSLGTTYYLNPGSDGQLGYEKDIKTDGSVEERSFITAYGQVVAVMKRITQSGTTTYPVSYFHRDHLGSTTTVTNEAGAVVERLAYEAFGKRRFASGVQDPTGSIVPLNTDRGFTNHEHIDELGVIHMNGRIYDPTIGRFMSADPYIQDPNNLQSYNRYSYVWNSPLNGTDPSGYFNLGHFLSSTWKDIWNSSVGRVAVTVAVAWYTGYGDWSSLGGGTQGLFTDAVANGAAAGFSGGFVGSGGNLRAGVYGGITGGAFGWVGGQGLVGFDAIAAHAAVGCATSSISGGDCGGGALSAGFGKFATQYMPGYIKGDVAYELTYVSVVGGTASVLGGGKFANGAQTAAFGYLFNYCAHNGCFNRRFNWNDAVDQWRNGNGSTVTGVQASELNLTDATYTKNQDGSYQIHTRLKFDTGAIYGTVTGVLNTDGTMSIKPDSYDFRMQNPFKADSLAEFGRLVWRDVATGIGHVINRSGSEYRIEFTGSIPAPNNLPR